MSLTWRRYNIYFFNIQIRVISTTFVTQQQPQYSNFSSHKFLNKCFTVYIDVPIFIELTNAHNFLRHTWGSHDIRELKQRCFWAMHINQKWDLFHFKIYWQYQNCISQSLSYYRNDLSKHLVKITAQEWKKSTSGWHESFKRIYA